MQQWLYRMDNEITIHTDGGCEPNPGPGGWGAIILEGDKETVIDGNDPDSTNNRMELTAAIEALNYLESPSNVTLISDSKYVVQGMTEWIDGWKSKNWRGVKNSDLWQTLDEAASRHSIEWEWVRGHAGNEFNERVDEIATLARKRLSSEAPEEYAQIKRERPTYVGFKVGDIWEATINADETEEWEVIAVEGNYIEFRNTETDEVTAIGRSMWG